MFSVFISYLRWQNRRDREQMAYATAFANSFLMSFHLAGRTPTSWEIDMQATALETTTGFSPREVAMFREVCHTTIDDAERIAAGKHIRLRKT